MKYLIIFASLFIISCWNDEVVNNNFDNQEYVDSGIPQGYANWWKSAACELLVDQPEGYFTGDDLYSNIPGIQILIPVTVKNEEVRPLKVSWYFNGNLAGYSGGIEGRYSVILTLPDTEFVSIVIFADNCPMVMWNADINWKYKGDGSELKLPPPKEIKVYPKINL